MDNHNVSLPRFDRKTDEYASKRFLFAATKSAKDLLFRDLNLRFRAQIKPELFLRSYRIGFPKRANSTAPSHNKRFPTDRTKGRSSSFCILWKTYRAALVGLTGIGAARPSAHPLTAAPRSHAAAYFHHPRTDLVAVCDKNPAALDQFREIGRTYGPK